MWGFWVQTISAFETMKKLIKKRLAKLAIALLENSQGKKLYSPKGEEMHFNMSDYASKNDGGIHPNEQMGHACGSNCCFAGYAPFIFPAARKMHSWTDVVEYLLGSESCSNAHREAHDFLFDDSWPDRPRDAAARALLFINQDGEIPRKHTRVPKWYGPSKRSYDRVYYSSYSKARLIEELQAHI